MTDPRETYHYWRKVQPDLPASQALSYAKYARQMRETLERFGEWQFAAGEYAAFAHADLDIEGPYTVRVLIGQDNQPTEWGDCEPSDEEREHAESFYVAVQVLDDAGTELYHNGIGGVDAIDLPGYLQRDWEDAAAYALMEYLLADAERFATNEDAERTHWAARDVETV